MECGVFFSIVHPIMEKQIWYVVGFVSRSCISGCKCSSFVAFGANDADTPVYCGSRTKARGRAANSAAFYATCNPTESDQLYGRDETILVYVTFTFNARKLFSLVCAFSRQLKLNDVCSDFSRVCSGGYL